MIKTILVIGEVTRQQYQEARLQALRQDHRPKIVRVSPDVFWIGLDRLEKLYATPEEQAQEARLAWNGATPEQNEASLMLMHELAGRHLAQYGDLFAVILGPESVEAYDRNHWVKRALQKMDVPVFQYVANGLLEIG